MYSGYKLLSLSFFIASSELCVCAQSLSVSYDGEIQYDLGTHFQSSHLLWLEAQKSLSSSLSAQVSAFTLAMTHETPLVDDLQGFSNLDAENTLFALAVADLKWKINEQNSLFLGIRNMNEDYFCSPVTSFFTNASCGIFPTLSFNYPIANYPLASMGIHYAYENEHLVLQGSLYNGLGYKKLTGRMNQFRFCPQSDGLLALAQCEYRRSDSSYFLGTCLYDDASSSQVSSSIWCYSEPRITDNLHMILSYSHAFGTMCVCRDYVAIGCVVSCNRFELGLHTDYARFDQAEEFATELSLHWPLTSYCTLQPALHYFSNTSAQSLVALFRVSLAF